MRSTFSLLFYINRAKVKADAPPRPVPHHHRRAQYRTHHRHRLPSRRLEPQEGRDSHCHGQQPTHRPAQANRTPL